MTESGYPLAGGRRAQEPDYAILLTLLVLSAWGLVMLYSASAIWAEQVHGDPTHFLKRQALWFLLGLAGMLAAANIDFNRLREWSRPMLLLCAIGLVAVLFDVPVSGARRWIRLGSFSLQPSEFAKLAVVIYLADYLDRRRSRMEKGVWGALAPAMGIAPVLALIAVEPDLGTPVLLFGVALLMLYLGGARLWHLAGLAALSGPFFVYEILRHPYRLERFRSFLHPFADPQGSSYQTVQSLLAVGSGGWIGEGIGSSKLKLLYLPTPHTDFIFPVLCEEMGLVGSLGVAGLFTYLLLRGLKTARLAPNLFGGLLAAGLTFLIVLQAYVNMGVSLGLVPAKGLGLPFFSYGGSSLLASFLAMGILLNISSRRKFGGHPT